MGQDENKNTSALDELNRISADSNPNASANVGAGFGNTAGGDIILNSQPAQRRGGKRKLLFILVIAVVAVLIIALIIMVIGKKANEDKVKQANNKLAYIKLLQYGDPEIDKEVDTSLPYEYSYIHNVADKFGTEADAGLADKIERLFNGINDESLKNEEVVDVEKAYLMLLRTNKELDEIENAFLNEGEEKARSLYAEQAKDVMGDDYNVRSDTSETVVGYKNAQVEMLSVYKKYNCIDNKAINYGCVDVLNSMIYGLEDYRYAGISLKQTKRTIYDSFKNVSESFYNTNMSYFEGSKE